MLFSFHTFSTIKSLKDLKVKVRTESSNDGENTKTIAIPIYTSKFFELKRVI